MKKPLFEVGETVVRQVPSPYYSECNGEYIVEAVISQEEYDRTIESVVSRPGFYYKLRDLVIHVKNLDGDKTGEISNHSWEGFLRKKHKPSDLSFQELVSSLKLQIKTPIKA